MASSSGWLTSSSSTGGEGIPSLGSVKSMISLLRAAFRIIASWRFTSSYILSYSSRSSFSISFFYWSSANFFYDTLFKASYLALSSLLFCAYSLLFYLISLFSFCIFSYFLISSYYLSVCGSIPLSFYFNTFSLFLYLISSWMIASLYFLAFWSSFELLVLFNSSLNFSWAFLNNSLVMESNLPWYLF